MKHEYLLSIITPTYNRAKLLNQCFVSLQKQTDSRFEWIIIDDGSTDETKTAVSSFIHKAPEMRIVFIQKENGGKHTALNASHPYIHGDFVLILDSDDYLTETAVEEVLAAWDQFASDPTIGTIVFLKGLNTEKPLAVVKEWAVPVDYFKCKRIGSGASDCCETLRTELFLQFPFPEYPNERFLSEGVLWKQVASNHRYIYINKIIYICDYLEDGLTKSGRAMRLRSPLGGMLNSSMNMDPRFEFKSRLKNGILYNCYGFFAGMRAKEIVNWNHDYQPMKAVCLLPGYLLYKSWKKKYFG